MLIGAEDDVLWDTAKYIRRMKQRMKELMPIYHVIGKIPTVRNISNKIIVMEKHG